MIAISEIMDTIAHAPIQKRAMTNLGVLNEAFQYAKPSSFSRGMRIDLNGLTILLISGTASIDFGTKKGASTANGVVNGMGSIGQMLGVLLPGWVETILGKGHNIWPGIFVGLGISLVVAGLMLAPLWNRLPPKAR